MIPFWLIVYSVGVNTVVHYFNPTIFWTQNEQRHKSLTQVIKIVPLINPLITVVQTILSRDNFS